MIGTVRYCISRGLRRGNELRTDGGRNDVNNVESASALSRQNV